MVLVKRFLLALLLPAAVQALAAQVPGGLRPVGVGSRVKVYAPGLRGDPYIGQIDSLDARVMVLDTTGARTKLGIETAPVLVDRYRYVAIGLAEIQRIEVSAGRTVTGPAVKGAIFGGLIGGVVLGLGNMPEVNPSTADFVRAMPPGIVAGAIVGGVLGWLLGGERWLPASLPR